MRKRDETEKSASELRRKAEACVGQSLKNAESACSGTELLHEPRIQQIELEMQNESSRQSRIALEESRDRYADFYDFSPVGFLSLDEQGLITELNLTGAEILGATRGKLVRSRFSPSVAVEDRDRWQ